MFLLQAWLWPRGWVELMLYSSMTTALEGGECSAARPGRTLPRERTCTHCTGGCLAPEPVWTGGKMCVPLGFDPRTVQPEVSRYTDWATRPTSHIAVGSLQSWEIFLAEKSRQQQAQQTDGNFHSGIWSLQQLSGFGLRHCAHRDWKLFVMLLNCNPQLLTGKFLKVYKKIY